MSTLRITNIEAKGDPSSPSIDEKVKIKDSTGNVILEVDGKAGAGETVFVSAGIVTATQINVGTGVTITDGTLQVGTGITISAGVITATSFSGDGSNLSGIDATSLKDSDGNVIVQAEASGLVITGIATVTSKLMVGDSYISAGNVGLGTTTTAGRDAGIGTAVGSMIYNTTTGSVQIYKQNAGWSTIQSTGDQPPGGIEATGGIISDYTDPGPGIKYRSHTFTSSGTFVVSALATSEPNALEYLVIGGGGGGGTSGTGGGGGGGGAGGYRSSVVGENSGGGGSAESTITATVKSYTVTVGAGGASHPWVPSEPNNVSPNGANSVFDSITSIGGGGGAANHADGGTGGSGGGANSRTSTGNQGSGTANQGFPGGVTGGPGIDNTATGGGGAGAAGQAPPNISSNFACAGGVGLESSINGTATLRGGGGGSSGNQAQSLDGGAGGNGGGGDGAKSPNGWRAQSGSFSTGGGGGGNNRGSGQPYPNPENTGGHGGSGVVIVRYQIAAHQTGTAKATGGEVSFFNGKTIHTFTNSGTFTAPASFNETVEYVVVAGGGAGANSQGGGTSGGGGGAGGYRTGTQTVTGPSPIAITVGAGGVARNITTNISLPTGSDSVFASSTPITSNGGGHGSVYNMTNTVTPGGSGGGGSFGGGAGNGNDPPTSPPQGNPGGDGSQTTGQRGGGGGGAGAAGIHGDTSGNGGLGAQLPATFRNPFSTVGTPGPGGSYYLAGGGGGGVLGSVPAGSGGAGGGAAGAGPTSSPGTNATEATGGGGGGIGGASADAERGGNGGSGIVLLAYPT